MKDKRNRHGTMGKSSSEQQFRKSDMITFTVLNFWSRTPSTTGSYGSLVGRRNPLNFRNFQNSLYVDRNNRLFALFNKCTALLQLCQCV